MILRNFLAAAALVLGAAPALAQLPVVPGEPAFAPKSLPAGMVRLPADAPVTRAKLAPVTVADVSDRTAPWWSPLTEGDTQTVEFFVPATHDPAKLALRVMRASHLFTTPSSHMTKRIADIGSSGSCEVDIACSSLDSDTGFR